MPPSADKVYAFRQPFKAVAALSQKTGTLTKPVDPYVEATIDYAYKGYEVRRSTSQGCELSTRLPLSEAAGHNSGYVPRVRGLGDCWRQVVKTKVEKVPKVSPYLLVALGLLASATISFFLIIPAIIFFPLTILLGIVSAPHDCIGHIHARSDS